MRQVTPLTLMPWAWQLVAQLLAAVSLWLSLRPDVQPCVGGGCCHLNGCGCQQMAIRAPALLQTRSVHGAQGAGRDAGRHGRAAGGPP